MGGMGGLGLSYPSSIESSLVVHRALALSQRYFLTKSLNYRVRDGYFTHPFLRPKATYIKYVGINKRNCSLNVLNQK
jgi:hypothetical protein